MKSVSVEKENVNIKSLIRKAWNGVKETIATLNDLVGPTPVGGGSDSRVKAEVSKVEKSQSPRIPQLEGLFDYSKNAKVAEKENRPKEKKRSFLDIYGTNLTNKAKKNELDIVIGRDKEIERVIQILNRRSKNNPCLIGEPGVRENCHSTRTSNKNC